MDQELSGDCANEVIADFSPAVLLRAVGSVNSQINAIVVAETFDLVSSKLTTPVDVEKPDRRVCVVLDVLYELT